MALNKDRAVKTTGSTRNSQVPVGPMWDQKSVDENDGTANTNAGDRGREPGGRWSPAYYDTPACIIGKVTVRKP
jgi:hypothetical protein